MRCHPLQAYNQSKLALNMWTFMLAAKLHKAHHPATVHCIDPGAAATKVRRQRAVLPAGREELPLLGSRGHARWRACSCGSVQPVLRRGPLCKPPPICLPQVLLAGWGEVAHSVAMRAYECNDEEWAVRDPALARCTGRYWVVSGGRWPWHGWVWRHRMMLHGRTVQSSLPGTAGSHAPQNRKPRMSPKGAHSLAAQQRLWDVLVQQTGIDFELPQPEGLPAEA